MISDLLEAINKTTGEKVETDTEYIGECKHGEFLHVVFLKEKFTVCPYCQLEAKVSILLSYAQKMALNDHEAQDILDVIENQSQEEY